MSLMLLFLLILGRGPPYHNDHDYYDDYHDTVWMQLVPSKVVNHNDSQTMLEKQEMTDHNHVDDCPEGYDPTAGSFLWICQGDSEGAIGTMFLLLVLNPII